VFLVPFKGDLLGRLSSWLEVAKAMGLQEMDADLFKITIKLSQPCYWQGNVVSGNVEMSSKGAITVKDLIIKLKGTEKTRLHVSAKDQQMEKKTIFCSRLSIFEGKIKAGKHNFTFQFPLPAVLPGTFSLEEGTNYGIIYYYAKATLTVSEAEEEIVSTGHYSPKARMKRSGSIMALLKEPKIEFTPKRPPEIKIHTKLEPKQLRMPFKVLEKFGILKAYPVSNQNSINAPYGGIVKARLWLDRNAYFPGETVLARLKINSTSVRSIRNIVVNLVQTMSIQANGQKSETPSIVHSERQVPDLEPCYLGVRWVPITIPSDTPLSSSQGDLTHLSYKIEVNFDELLIVSVPITILIRQYFESLHALRPPTAVLPPPSQIRPPWQPDHKASRCNSCNVAFNILKLRSHCRHCGKVFCRDCVSTKIPIPKLKFDHSVRVCLKCVEVITETGGVVYQSPKQVLEGWHKQYSPQWIPNYKVTS